MQTRLLITITAVLAAILFCVEFSQAQEVKMAFFDWQKFMSKSTRAKEQWKKLNDLLEMKRTALENKKKELLNLQEQLQKQGPMLKEETRNDKIKEIGIKEMELKLAEKEAQNTLQNEERAATEVLQRDLIKIVSKIRAQKNLAMVFNSNVALLSADDALDITDEVVKQYDAEGDSGKPAATKPKPAAPHAAPPAAPAQPSAKPKAPGK